MMYKYILCFLFLLGIQSEFGWSKPIVFDSQRNKEIYDLMTARFGAVIVDDFQRGTMSLRFDEDSVPVVVRWNSNSEVQHIGWDIRSIKFSRDLSDLDLKFLSRYILELFLWQDVELIKNRLIADKVSLRWGTMAWGESGFTEISRLGAFIESDVVLSLKKVGKMQLASFTRPNGEVLILEYPANRQLYSGLDKVDYGISVANALKAQRSLINIAPRAFDGFSLLNVGDSIFSLPGHSFYLLSEINSSVLVKRTPGKTFNLVDSALGVCESVRNIFLKNDYVADDYLMHVEHRIYGSELVEHYSVSLRSFVNYFRNDFSFYSGCETDVDIFSFTTFVLYNEEMQFLNLLYVSADSKSFFSSSPKISAKFYTGIPLHNLNQLYANIHD